MQPQAVPPPRVNTAPKLKTAYTRFACTAISGPDTHTVLGMRARHQASLNVLLAGTLKERWTYRSSFSCLRHCRDVLELMETMNILFRTAVAATWVVWCGVVWCGVRACVRAVHEGVQESPSKRSGRLLRALPGVGVVNVERGAGCEGA